MKFLQVWWSSFWRQLRGQPTSTVLCCSPPSPLDWMRWDMPSRRLEEMTTWQKPFTFSASIRRRMDWGRKRGLRDRGAWGCPASSTLARGGLGCRVWGQVPVGCPGPCAPSKLLSVGREG